MSDIQILFPEPVTALVAGRRVKIRPVTLANFERFGKAAGMIMAMATSKTAEQLYAYCYGKGLLMDVLQTVTDLPAWRIKRLPAMVAVELMLAVIEINKGFFEKALVSAAAKSPAAQIGAKLSAA